ncbi:methyltransferase family protein [Sphingomonas jeddahensis]|uniref:Isoprenylcysteine carboxyl methyltransferase (ICMT) family protein n=1 Tax=Sphingomonas jeddahensis TaxID=1915074 RepID=A0A1V2EYC4_9SPHN|nr:isoprenylcysteine carboxylmethyltransferase family protein [Sphingomonas jeddahensis]ONF97666.1 Isoprenylcysteine carboxyl methyltransferase (ICMT) family protein [Sphingomonas jeddahensis]
MSHQSALATASRADPRPASAVSHGVGIAGLVGVIAWIAVARTYGMDGPYAALVNLLACGVPMVLWSVLVDKVHRRPSTGIDWAKAKPWRETFDVSLVKLVGLWATWAGIALIYATGRFYWEGNFSFAMWCFGVAAPALFVLSIPYVLWLDRRLVEPRDGAWSFGVWLTHTGSAEPEAIYNHLRAWAVKAFFLAFMLAIVPPGFGEFVRTPSFGIFADPVRLANWLITFMFVIDVAFATVGYVLTMRPLDSHIRSATPYAAGWAAALICYPPFLLMEDGGPLDYHPGTADWTYWLQGHPLLLATVGAVLVVLTAIYAWATVAFGVRFSNLTHRGILTHGPYAWSRHPAYLSKNLFWWISTVPLLSTGSLVDAARSTLILSMVSGVYYWRARTEERHLLSDPVYREYSGWMSRHAPVPRFFRWVGGR